MASDPCSSWGASSPFLCPPWLRFVPTDEELITYYLKPFSENNTNSLLDVPIHHVNIYESNPQQLSARYEKGNLNEWFFITERTTVVKGGKRQKRGDNNGGYWHATQAAKEIKAEEGVFGYKTALAYYVGKPQKGVKTDWLMHEYWLKSAGHDKPNEDNKVGYALCKIYQSPMAKKKKKEEGYEAYEEAVYKPHNVQPQPQPQLCPLDFMSDQPQQPQPLGVVDNQQPQFWPPSMDTHQSQEFEIASLVESFQPELYPQFWSATLDP